MEQLQSIQESCPTICSSSCLPSYPFFVVRCLRWCQAHVQAVALWAAFCHANNIVVKSADSSYLSITKCNSLWRHVPGAPLSCLIWTIVIFNKILITNRKCLAKLFAAAKLCNTYTICPSFCSSYCSHSWPQGLLHGTWQKSLAVQEADYNYKS